MIQIVNTTPYTDQKMGTAGLRKKTRTVMQKNYLEKFMQSIFNTIADFDKKSFLIFSYCFKISVFTVPHIIAQAPKGTGVDLTYK